MGVMAFCLGVESIKGTVMEQRVKDAVKNKDKTTAYKPREGTVNKNAFRYNAEQMQYIKDKCGDLLLTFGCGDFFGEEKKASVTIEELNAASAKLAPKIEEFPGCRPDENAFFKMLNSLIPQMKIK